MKAKLMSITILAFLTTSLFLLAPVNASTFPNLPEDPIDLVLTVGPTKWPGTVALSNVPVGDYDVTNSPPSYTAWCAQLLNWIDPGTAYSATLESSLDLMPQETWNKINWLLNQEVEKDLDVQIAIWLLLGYTEAELATHGYTDLTAAQVMFNDANNHDGFIPSTGQILVVYCRIAEEYLDTGEEAQDLLIELEIPGEYEGLTPGFWKNCKLVWVGYSRDGSFFNTEFGTSITINLGKHDPNGDPTFDKALRARNGINEEEGIYDALVRHAVAALLNAAHPDVNYPMTEAEIIAAVAEAISNGDTVLDAEPLKDMLESYNELGGGIDAHGNPI